MVSCTWDCKLLSRDAIQFQNNSITRHKIRSIYKEKSSSSWKRIIYVRRRLKYQPTLASSKLESGFYKKSVRKTQSERVHIFFVAMSASSRIFVLLTFSSRGIRRWGHQASPGTPTECNEVSSLCSMPFSRGHHLIRWNLRNVFDTWLYIFPSNTGQNEYKWTHRSKSCNIITEDFYQNTNTK